MMETVREGILTAWQAMSWLEVAAVALGIAYVILAARQNILCWPAALGSTGIYFYLMLDAKLYLESGLQVFYLLMAIYGWWAWLRSPSDKQAQTPTKPVTHMSGLQHALVVGLGVVFTLGMGFYFDNHTNANMPYVDAFTTGFALITTYMVTEKKLENWLYWVVIDAVTIYLYFSREFYLSGLLMFAYTIIAVVGYFQWRNDMHKQAQISVST